MTRVVAEIGSTHDGSLGNATRLIQTSAEIGADAVKFQLHISNAEMTDSAPSPQHFADEERRAYFDRIAFSDVEWKILQQTARASGLAFICSPFSNEAVERLEEIGVDAYKVASGEVTNVPLLKKLATTGKPTILSSGMTNWTELDEAVSIFDSTSDLTILQCSSIYPCPPEEVGLNLIDELRRRYGRPVGLSDHTIGLAAALAAVAGGATLIEKHLTFSRRMYGSDAPYATEPREFAHLVQEIRSLDLMMLHPVDKDRLDLYEDTRLVFQKSVVAALDLRSGTKLTLEHVAFKKPGDGLSPARVDRLIGRVLRRDLARDQRLSEEDFE